MVKLGRAICPVKTSPLMTAVWWPCCCNNFGNGSQFDVNRCISWTGFSHTAAMPLAWPKNTCLKMFGNTTRVQSLSQFCTIAGAMLRHKVLEAEVEVEACVPLGQPLAGTCKGKKKRAKLQPAISAPKKDHRFQAFTGRQNSAIDKRRSCVSPIASSLPENLPPKFSRCKFSRHPAFRRQSGNMLHQFQIIQYRRARNHIWI